MIDQGQRRHVLIIVEYDALARHQRLNNVKCGRLTNVAHITFVCNAHYEYCCTIEATKLFVQCFTDLIYNIIRHASVNLCRQLDKAGSIIERFELPGEILWIDW